MPSDPPTSDAGDQAFAGIPSCALDEAGVREQRARYGRLALSVNRVEREAQAVLIEFREGFDQETLGQALAIERECCPFFRFELDEPKRRLRATVHEAEHIPALDALAHALGGAQRVGGWD